MLVSSRPARISRPTSLPAYLSPKSRIVSSADASQYPSIAVAIPCYNEAAAIATVIASWREHLPEAEIVVFDNNSNDGTGTIARDAGVRVIDVRDQGKGHAVCAIFRYLADHDAVIMVDGDGTYPASESRKLLAPVLDGLADMTVGARQPVDEAGAMSPVRGLGNILIRGLFRVMIGKGPGDLLSGYRVFSRRYLAEVLPRSAGFEIESELAGEAVARNLRTAEVPVPYHPRIAGTESKLRAFRDGRRIAITIMKLAFRLRPARVTALIVGLTVICGLLITLILRSGR